MLRYWKRYTFGTLVTFWVGQYVTKKIRYEYHSWVVFITHFSNVQWKCSHSRAMFTSEGKAFCALYDGYVYGHIFHYVAARRTVCRTIPETQKSNRVPQSASQRDVRNVISISSLIVYHVTQEGQTPVQQICCTPASHLWTACDYHRGKWSPDPFILLKCHSPSEWVPGTDENTDELHRSPCG